MTRRRLILTEVAPGVTFAQGPLSNWVVLVGDGEVGLIDSGYPTDAALVERSIAQAGGGGLPVRTVLVTHGHSDHIGGVAHLVRRFGATVYAAADEIPNVRREITEQITFGEVLPRLWRPRVAAWVVRAIRAGGLADVAVPTVRALPAGPLRVAGSTVAPLVVPGHTRGHTVYVLPDADALATGDALVTAHPTARRRGVQMLPDMFHADPAHARSSLAVLERLHTSVLLPGHGPLVTRSPQAAVIDVLAAAPRVAAEPPHPDDSYEGMPRGAEWFLR